MELLQPQVIKFNDNINLPETVRGKYFLYYILNGLFVDNAIQAIYVNMNSIDKLTAFISYIDNTDISLLFTGDNTFVLGQDYYLNQALGQTFDYVDYSLCLPNYMTKQGVNYEYFDIVNELDKFNSYYAKHNEITNSHFTEEELHNFYATVSTLILSLTEYVPTGEEIDYVYTQVLNYFAAHKMDAVYIGMARIFNTMIPATNTKIGCGCNTTDNNTSTNLISCQDYYTQAMVETIQLMFADPNFYDNWFYVIEPVTGIKLVNETLINQLNLFIDEFLALELNLSLNPTTTKKCDCPTLDTTSDECNRNIISNFKHILNYVYNNEIDMYVNHIKVYGKEFGKIFPNLSF